MYSEIAYEIREKSTVRLYDKNGDLITEQKQTIRNIIGTVHTP